MNRPVTFKTPSGDEMAVVPLAEYERLVEAAEMASDMRAYDEAKARLASGQEELVPAELVSALLSGEHPVRAWRRHRGLSGRELALKAGLGSAYLSQIETRRRDGTMGVMRRIADALSVPLDELADR